jgi:hypothetical protein
MSSDFNCAWTPVQHVKVMIMYNEMERIGEAAVITYFKFVSQNSYEYAFNSVNLGNLNKIVLIYVL